ncbi:MAG: metal-dependent hydrolase [Vicinamibacterales bacterium]|nr:metal-dependent hydrolase [Vicinamibacterales bacterium]
MPSPAGHLLAGVAVAWAAEAFAPRRFRVLAGGPAAAAPIVTPLVLASAALALAPDLDILLASHRTYTHSLAAAALAALAGGSMARALRVPALATGLTCGLAVASHIALDWLGHDTSTPRGLLALWPVSSAYFYSGIDLFADISRRYWKPEEFILKNAVSVARELAILGPVAGLAWWARRRSVSSRPVAPERQTSA